MSIFSFFFGHFTEDHASSSAQETMKNSMNAVVPGSFADTSFTPPSAFDSSRSNESLNRLNEMNQMNHSNHFSEPSCHDMNSFHSDPFSHGGGFGGCGGCGMF